MQDVLKDAKQLLAAITDAMGRLHIDVLETELQAVQTKAADPKLWDDQVAAQALLKQQANLDQRIKKWRGLETATKDILELAESGDETLTSDLTKKLVDKKAAFIRSKTSLLFAGPFDDHVVIISIHAGAGGTDAQDWAQMLHRMYFRFAEKEGGRVQQKDESLGDKAGLKNPTIKVYRP